MESDAELLLKVRARSNLLKSWLRVRANGVQSKSARTRREVEVFAEHSELNLSRLYRKLQRGKFAFEKAIGVPIRRPGKAPRPIVIATVQERIVQRSILNVLQQIDTIKNYIQIDTSFGGLKERAVSKAIGSIVSCVKQSNLTYYARSDINNFFQGIPKDIVIGKIKELIGDRPAFLEFLRAAVDVELSNIDELGEYVDLFPNRSIGIAQGGCLSTLLGNILLHDFDLQLNGRGISCFRYIDDFIILGRDRANVMKAYHSACELLGQHGLIAHEPKPGSSKASAGPITEGFEFLGCRILPGLITPNHKSRQRLLGNIRAKFEQSKQYLKICEQLKHPRPELSFSRTMADVNNSLYSWGNQYSFCNDKITLTAIQRDVNSLVYDYLEFFRATVRTSEEKKLFRSLGMHLLLESKSSPISWTVATKDAVRSDGQSS